MLLGENFKGEMNSIMNSYFNAEVYVDGVLDNKATAERAANIIEDFSMLVDEAALESESLILGLDFKNQEIRDTALAETANQFKNMINNKEAILGKLKKEEGMQELYSGEGAGSLRESLLEAQSSAPGITDNELRQSLEANTQKVRDSWIKSYNYNTFEGQLEFLSDHQAGMFDDFPQVKTSAEKIYRDVASDLGNNLLATTVSSNQKSGTSGISGSPGSLAMNEVPQEDIDAIREIASDMEPGSREQKRLLHKASIMEESNRKSVPLLALVEVLASEADALGVAEAVRLLNSKYKFGPQEIQALDNAIDISGGYNNFDDKDAERYWALFSNISDAKPSIFKKQLEGWLQQGGGSGHTAAGWNTVAKIGTYLKNNNLGMDEGLQIKTINFSRPFETGVGDGEFIWKNASSKLKYASDSEPGGLGYKGTIETILSSESNIPPTS